MPSTRFARAIYWRAKPGQLQAYNDYLHEFVEPVDHAAQRNGALETFTTLIDPRPDAPWTHMRLFVFSTAAQRAGMVEALGKAAAALTPDAALRQARTERAANLRERVGEADFDVL